MNSSSFASTSPSMWQWFSGWERDLERLAPAVCSGLVNVWDHPWQSSLSRAMPGSWLLQMFTIREFKKKKLRKFQCSLVLWNSLFGFKVTDESKSCHKWTYISCSLDWIILILLVIYDLQSFSSKGKWRGDTGDFTAKAVLSWSLVVCEVLSTKGIQ